MRVRIALAVGLVLVGILVFSLFLFEPIINVTKGVVSAPNVALLESFKPNDFLGKWYNFAGGATDPSSENMTVIYFQIAENQGTYTIDVNGPFFYERSMTTLTLDPPYAHAFYIFQQQSESVDLHLQLLNTTSMQVRESFQYQDYNNNLTTILQTEQFARNPPWLAAQQQAEQPQPVKQQVIMEAYDWTGVNLVLTLRNVGPAQVQFSDWFINGALATASGSCTGSAKLGVGASCTATLTPPTSPSAGVAYVVKAVSIDGAVFSYSAIDGSAS